MSAIHLNPLKCLSQKFMRVFLISSLMMPVTLIQYRGTAGIFNNRRFSSSSLNYSYISNKYHNDDTFTLTIGNFISLYRSPSQSSDSFEECADNLQLSLDKISDQTHSSRSPCNGSRNIWD